MLRYYGNNSSADLWAAVPGLRLQGVKALEFKNPKPPRIGQDGMEWDGVRQDRIEQDRIAHNSMRSV